MDGTKGNQVPYGYEHFDQFIFHHFMVHSSFHDLYMAATISIILWLDASFHGPVALRDGLKKETLRKRGAKGTLTVTNSQFLEHFVRGKVLDSQFESVG